MHNKNRKLIEITCDTDSEPGKDIAALTINNGLSLYEMRRLRPSLEDIFLELTTEEEIED